MSVNHFLLENLTLLKGCVATIKSCITVQNLSIEMLIAVN